MRVMAIVAHPDDIEFMMAGTLIQLGDAGCELHYMTVANGSCGSTVYDAATTAAIRTQEARAAAASIQATYHEPLCNDLEIFYEAATLRRLAAVIRQVAPAVLLTHPPVDYMEDHMNTCRLVLTAAFARGAANFGTAPRESMIEQDVAIYHSLPYGLSDPLGRAVEAAFYVDIGSVLARKAATLALHESQQAWLEASQGVESPVDHMRAISRRAGRLSGSYEFAEGWTQHLAYGYGPPGWDPLCDVLADRWVHSPSS